MKHAGSFFLALMMPLAAFAADGPLVLTPVRAGGPVGGANVQGCIPSAGYSWCARTNACERPWELAKAQGFDNTALAFDRYCSAPATGATPAAPPAPPASSPAKQSSLPGQTHGA